MEVTLEINMQSKILLSAGVAALLFGFPALSQTPAPVAPPMQNSPTAMPATSGMGGWLASKLSGVDVYNTANEKIGDISDAVIGRDGRIEAVIISVGGFLGMGKHHVGVPFADVKWIDDPTRMSTNTQPAPIAPTPNTAGAPVDRSPTGTVRTTTSTEWRGVPNRIVVNMTKEQLKAAPEYQYNR